MLHVIFTQTLSTIHPQKMSTYDAENKLYVHPLHGSVHNDYLLKLIDRLRVNFDNNTPTEAGSPFNRARAMARGDVELRSLSKSFALNPERAIFDIILEDITSERSKARFGVSKAHWLLYSISNAIGYFCASRTAYDLYVEGYLAIAIVLSCIMREKSSIPPNLNRSTNFLHILRIETVTKRLGGELREKLVLMTGFVDFDDPYILFQQSAGFMNDFSGMVVLSEETYQLEKYECLHHFGAYFEGEIFPEMCTCLTKESHPIAKQIAQTVFSEHTNFVFSVFNRGITVHSWLELMFEYRDKQDPDTLASYDPNEMMDVYMNHGQLVTDYLSVDHPHTEGVSAELLPEVNSLGVTTLFTTLSFYASYVSQATLFDLLYVKTVHHLQCDLSQEGQRQGAKRPSSQISLTQTENP